MRGSGHIPVHQSGCRRRDWAAGRKESHPPRSFTPSCIAIPLANAMNRMSPGTFAVALFREAKSFHPQFDGNKVFPKGFLGDLPNFGSGLYPSRMYARLQRIQ